MYKGIIYKIELDDEIYIGSTEQKLCVRQSNHNEDLKRYPHRTLYKKCIEQGMEYIKLIWVADIEFNSTAEKRAIEEEYRKELNAKLNMYKCYLSKDDKKEYRKEWYSNHKEQSKNYYYKHKEKIDKYQNIYRKKHRIKTLEKNNAKTICDVCGVVVNFSSINRHKKTKKCIKASQSIL